MFTPKNIFLIDGLGALLTVLCLLLFSGDFNVYVGMPPPILHTLAAVAALFAVYSWACYFFLKKNQSTFLRFIGIANLSYCFLTGGLLIYKFSLLTWLGLAYFLAEILIICILSSIEITISRQSKKSMD